MIVEARWAAARPNSSHLDQGRSDRAAGAVAVGDADAAVGAQSADDPGLPPLAVRSPEADLLALTKAERLERCLSHELTRA